VSIKAEARVEAPDDVNVTVSITMTAGVWREFQHQNRSGSWPSWAVAEAVRDAITKFSESHYSTSDYER
jgi:hypothetical protein